MKKKTTKILRSVTPDGSFELARFRLEAGRVHATYINEDFREEIERIGLCTAKGPRITPADGKLFFEELDVAYSRSSTIVVETLTIAVETLA